MPEAVVFIIRLTAACSAQSHPRREQGLFVTKTEKRTVVKRSMRNTGAVTIIETGGHDRPASAVSFFCAVRFKLADLPLLFNSEELCRHADSEDITPLTNRLR